MFAKNLPDIYMMSWVQQEKENTVLPYTTGVLQQPFPDVTVDLQAQGLYIPLKERLQISASLEAVFNTVQRHLEAFPAKREDALICQNTGRS